MESVQYKLSSLMIVVFAVGVLLGTGIQIRDSLLASGFPSGGVLLSAAGLFALVIGAGFVAAWNS